MRVDAEELRGLLLHLNQAQGPAFKLHDDPRVTRVGRILRKTSPRRAAAALARPPGRHEPRGAAAALSRGGGAVRAVDAAAASRCGPGLTCLWQIRGRSDLPFDEWMRLDLEYVERCSFLLDVKILLLTVPAVLSGRGAY